MQKENYNNKKNENTTDITINNSITEKSESEIKTEEKNKKEKNINNDIAKLGEKIKQIEKEKDKLKALNIQLLQEKENIKKEKEDKIDKLKGKINLKNNTINTLVRDNKKISEIIKEKDKTINVVKSNLPFDLNEGEKLMCVIFQLLMIKEFIILLYVKIN